MQNILDDLETTLKQDDRLNADDELLKNKTIELALKSDEQLLELLLSDDTLKEHFFTDVNGTLVFDQDKFVKFVSNKEFLPDSYTRFKNKIGLRGGRRTFSRAKRRGSRMAVQGLYPRRRTRKRRQIS